MDPVLYLLTPDGWPAWRLLETTRSILQRASTPGWLQYRDKSAIAGSQRLEMAAALCQLCREHGWISIINDDPALALAADADGVHLGESDGAIAMARMQLDGTRKIGSSCYNSMERAQEAAAAGADYLAFGAFFASGTKPQAQRADPALLVQARALGLPLCAIGGITVDTAAGLVSAGADLIAVLGAVYGAADPVAAVGDFQAAIAAGATRR